jgi:hypothetical protein
MASDTIILMVRIVIAMATHVLKVPGSLYNDLSLFLERTGVEAWVYNPEEMIDEDCDEVEVAFSDPHGLRVAQEWVSMVTDPNVEIVS